MDLGFRGEVADFYHRYRRGYPRAVIDALVDAFGLGPDDVAVDLGCGTGQLTVPLAARVRAVVGMDPEPDMLARARNAAAAQAVTNVTWSLGADTDLPALGALLGDRSLAAVTIGQALHWMSHDELFATVRQLVRPGGGVAVVTNGVPIWLQDSEWSHVLRGCLEQWLGAGLTRTCGTDEASQRRYRDSLTAAGFRVRATSIDYTATLDLDQIIGGVYSALSVTQLPADRPRFAELISNALAPHAPFTEHVRVAILTGQAAANAV
jgi:ubiquinone/menaquinone biosynthesis C-methylase UbiE